jgi:hypothetical protein
VFADSRQTNVRRLSPVGNEKQDTAFRGDSVFLNTSLSRALLPKKVLRMLKGEIRLKYFFK